MGAEFPLESAEHIVFDSPQGIRSIRKTADMPCSLLRIFMFANHQMYCK